MIELIRERRKGVPIRVRLTLWYVLLMGLTFLLVSVYLFWQFRRTVLKAVDTSLDITVSQTLSSLENEDSHPAFQETNSSDGISRQLVQSGFAMRLISPEGDVLDVLGAAEDIPSWGPALPGFHTVRGPDGDEPWRIYTQPVRDENGGISGWLQASRSLDSVNSTLQDLRDQLWLGIPLVLILAGLGGYFLAFRALRPIDQITRTAQGIEASDLTRRIHFPGPPDEVGRLAQTFDQMLARLEAAFERERRFTADAAHELRTPLSILKGTIEVTLSRDRPRDAYRTSLQDLSRQVDRLIRLSNGLLFLSRIGQEKGSWAMEPLNLSDLLESILEQIEPIAVQRQLTLKVNIPPVLPVLGDTDPLIRLFLNLLDNAIKYTPAGGEIGVLGWAEGGRARIQISNSGPGIPPEHLPHVFERFYRVDASRSRQLGGAGLGLAIAQEIAQAHGGQVLGESGPDEGTSFTVVLPLASEPY